MPETRRAPTLDVPWLFVLTEEGLGAGQSPHLGPAGLGIGSTLSTLTLPPVRHVSRPLDSGRTGVCRQACWLYVTRQDKRANRRAGELAVPSLALLTPTSTPQNGATALRPPERYWYGPSTLQPEGVGGRRPKIAEQRRWTPSARPCCKQAAFRSRSLLALGGLNGGHRNSPIPNKSL
jgi:hypothetical protein